MVPSEFMPSSSPALSSEKPTCLFLPPRFRAAGIASSTVSGRAGNKTLAVEARVGAEIGFFRGVLAGVGSMLAPVLVNVC